MTINGLIVKTIKLHSNESQTVWDGTDEKGEHVGTAVYLVSANHESGKKISSQCCIDCAQ